MEENINTPHKAAKYLFRAEGDCAHIPEANFVVFPLWNKKIFYQLKLTGYFIEF
jgi:hypothetical protein